MDRPGWVDLDDSEDGSTSADDEVELAEMGIDLEASTCLMVPLQLGLDVHVLLLTPLEALALFNETPHIQASSSPLHWSWRLMTLFLQTFEDEEDERTTTVEQVAAGGDPQNIPWGRLQVSREQYRVSFLARSTACWYRRVGQLAAFCWDHTVQCNACMQETRLEQYHNYVNRTDVMRRSAAWLREQSSPVKKVHTAVHSSCRACLARWPAAL